MKTLIVGISGYKGSGKSALAKSLIRDAGQFSVANGRCDIFAFMDEGKRVCVKLLGLDPKYVYGSDDDKNEISHILWHDMPHYLEIRQKVEKEAWEEVGAADKKLNIFQKINRWCFLGGKEGDWADAFYRKMRKFSGLMTYRQVMQEVGTGIFRRMNQNCHVEATLSNIKDSGCGLAVIADVRFPNEVEAIKKAGGVVIRLTRSVAGEDRHESETKLDPDVYDWRQFDIILDNDKLDVGRQARQAMLGLASLGHVRDLNVAATFDGSKVLTINK